MKNSLLIHGALIGLIALSCQNVQDDDPARASTTSDEGEQELALSAVPQAVKDAALAAVPGLVIAEAETEQENGVTIYCIEGTAGGKEYEIEISADGQVLDIETEDDEDEEDDGEEDDD